MRLRGLFTLILVTLFFSVSSTPSLAFQEPNNEQTELGTSRLYIPMVQSGNVPAPRSAMTAVVNAPYFPDGVRTPETAIFWFGQVTPERNYADVRVGYSPKELYLHAAIIDRYLWYDPNARLAEFDQWDSLSLYLSNGENLYRFDGQMSWWEQRAQFQAAYIYRNNAWQLTPIEFRTRSSWRGTAPNDDGGDRGWILTYYLPFSSLGLNAAPQTGQVWRMGIVLHDRDAKSGPPLPPTVWPPGFTADRRESWGELRFGLPEYTPPPAVPGETVIIRQGLNGVGTPDAAVGGNTTCGDKLDYWTDWGENTDPNGEFLNVQNQYDIADWPCFSRYYVAFPLERVPPGKVILSARLVMHQFGSSGGGSWGEPPPSWIQVLRVQDGWRAETLTWNNNPLALENYNGTWVEGLPVFPGWPGIPYQWDVTQAVAEAYAAGHPVNLALYSSDGERHTGKYFVTADTPDWNAKARPRLEILWGNP